MYDDDYYSYLGVSHNASQEEIKQAYRKMLKIVHPDMGNKDDTAVKKLLMIYGVLSDPHQRHSYDDGRAYQYAKRDNQHKKSYTQSSEFKKEYEEPEDFSKAVFVNGIQGTDSYGTTDYIKIDDYIYYQVQPRKKFLFYEYTGKDYYRVKVHKIYSFKLNNFRKKPLFLVRFDGIEQVIFKSDFRKYWLSQKGFESRERRLALVTFAIEISVVVFIFYLILQMK